MRKSFLSLFAVCFVIAFAFTFTSCSTSDDVNDSTTEDNGLTEESPVPPFPGEIPADFTMKVVAEEVTGDWCGWCPIGLQAMADLYATYPNTFIPMAFHSGDPMAFSGAGSYLTASGDKGGGVPRGMFMRSDLYPGYWNESAYSGAKGGTKTTSGLAIDMVEDGDNYKITVYAGFASAASNDQMITVLATEDDIDGKQANYLSGNADFQTSHPYWYGESGTISPFSHQHVVRAVISADAGETIPSADASAGAIVSKEFTVAKSTFADATKGHIVVLLLDGDQATVANCQSVKVSDMQKAFD